MSQRPLRATAALVMVLVTTHAVTAGFARQPWGALVLPRSLPFRALVGGQQHALVAQGAWWRLVTSVFLHVDLLHLAVNASSLWVLGALAERHIGGGRWLAVFLFGGVGASIASQFAGVPASDGASGGAFALVGLLLVVRLRDGASMDDDARSVLGWPLALLALLNLVLGFALPGLDGVAHVAGLGLGLVMGLAVRWRVGD